MTITNVHVTIKGAPKHTKQNRAGRQLRGRHGAIGAALAAADRTRPELNVQTGREQNYGSAGPPDIYGSRPPALRATAVNA